MSDHEDNVAELLAEAVGALHSLETLVDRLLDVAEDIEDAAAETAFRSHGPIWRWTTGRRHRKIMQEMKAEHAEFMAEFGHQLKFPG